METHTKFMNFNALTSKTNFKGNFLKPGLLMFDNSKRKISQSTVRQMAEIGAKEKL